jgi:hypothetical protein
MHSRARTQLSLLLLTTLHALGCADTQGSEPAAERSGQDRAQSSGDDAAGAETTARGADSPSEFANEARLCELELNKSSMDDVKDVLGSPSSEDPNGPGVVLRYVDREGSTWIFFFDEHDVWSGFTLDSAMSTVVPSCWAPDGGWFDRPDGGWYPRSGASWREDQPDAGEP